MLRHHGQRVLRLNSMWDFDPTNGLMPADSPSPRLGEKITTTWAGQAFYSWQAALVLDVASGWRAPRDGVAWNYSRRKIARMSSLKEALCSCLQTRGFPRVGT